MTHVLILSLSKIFLYVCVTLLLNEKFDMPNKLHMAKLGFYLYTYFILKFLKEIFKKFDHFVNFATRNHKNERNPIVSKLIRVILCSQYFNVSKINIARLQYVMCTDCPKQMKTNHLYYGLCDIKKIINIPNQ